MATYIACDHAGVLLKRHLMAVIPQINWVDLGSHNEESVDYPDYASKLCEQLSQAPPEARGVLICGSGQGMAMRANRYPTIRAALVWSKDSARLAREHNDANVVCLGSRLVSMGLAQELLRIFLETPFEGGRHLRRVEKISQPIS
ncbi:MAG: ribose 5-phosphate isomerase B [Bdellovibrionales bacterium]|nr:ribose 5-phosphate isomerase B [Bdellovibrionales bacterium]